jgi:glutathione S-transferase
MKLYHAANSPYVRKVMILLLEAGRADEVTLVATTGGPVDQGTMPVAQNPLGKVPALERDDGPALYDSRVICRYLDDRLQAGLYPPAPRLWDTLVLEATGDGMMDAALLMVYESRVRPEERRHSPWVEAQWAKVARALDALEERWLSHLAGPLCMGQVAVAAALGYLDLRHDARGWREGRPGLAAFAERMAARDSLKATVSPG